MKISARDIESRLPLLAFEQNLLVGKAGEVTASFAVMLPEVFSLGKGDFDSLHQMWVRAMRALMDGCVVHKQDVFVERRFRPGQNASRGFLSSASDRHFSGRRHLDHSCYVYVTLPPASRTAPSASSSPLNAEPVAQRGQGGDRIADFETSVAAFAGILREGGLTVSRLTADELLGTEDSFGIIERYLNLDFSRKGVLQDIVFSEGGVRVGDRDVSVFAISDIDQMPHSLRTWSRHGKYSSENAVFAVGYPSSLCLALGFNHIYNQYFFLESNDSTLKEVDTQMRHQLSLSRVSRENLVGAEDNSRFIDEVTRGGLRTVLCAADIVLWDTSRDRLVRKNTLVTARLAALDITALKTNLVSPQMFWGGIPGCGYYFPHEMTFLTCLEQACCLINNESSCHSSASGAGIRLCDRIGGVPLAVDISDEPREKGWIDNRNKFILGPSGSGKSFFTNHMVRSYYEMGTHVVIVDVGDSYLGLCKMIREETGGKDGIYYTYKEDDPIRFNPFYVQDGRYTTEKREQLNGLVFVLWKGDEVVTKAEATHVSTAISGFIDDWVLGKGKFPTFNLFYEYLMSETREYVRREGIQRDNFDVENLIQVLRPYYKGGSYDYLLNATENLDLLHKRFIVFEIDNIKDHPTLFPVVTLVLMDTFISKMRHPDIASERKMILIEEAWKALSRQGTAEFIKYLYKTVRKHFGEAIVVTQEVDDIISNPIVKDAIISNADCKILLDQRKYQNKFDTVKNVLALTDKEIAIALSVNRDLHREGRSPYKEVFVSLNGNRTAVYGVEVSREEYLTYTTEKREKERLYALERECGSMRGAIERYIAGESADSGKKG